MIAKATPPPLRTVPVGPRGGGGGEEMDGRELMEVMQAMEAENRLAIPEASLVTESPS